MPSVKDGHRDRFLWPVDDGLLTRAACCHASDGSGDRSNGGDDI